MEIKVQELTVYKNEMNAVPFRQFNATDMDVFFSICGQMRDKGQKKIQFTFDEIKKISRYQGKDMKQFISDLDRTYSKMMGLNIRINYERGAYERFVLFTGFKVVPNEQYIEIETNKKFSHIINEITGDFTKFELKEFTKLRSSYAKTAFRLLKQFRLTGYWKIGSEDFRSLMDIPKSYRQTTINDRVINPIINELSPLFKGLTVKKIKAKKANRIEFFEFKFKPQDDIDENGKKIFRDADGNYYEKDLMSFAADEVDKAFPEPNKPEKKQPYGLHKNIHLTQNEYEQVKQKGLEQNITFMGDWKKKHNMRRGFNGGDYKRLLAWNNP